MTTELSLAEQIRQIMIALRFRQVDLARELGISLNRVKSLTSGRVAKLTTGELRTLTTRLGVSPQFLVSGDGLPLDHTKSPPISSAPEPSREQHTATHLDSDTLALANELSSISRQASRLGRELRDATLATLAAQLDAIAAEQRRMNERLARIEAALLPLAGRQS